MSSIMRCRSGFMALSVMTDAPVLMKVANPSSQDRTPRRAIENSGAKVLVIHADLWRKIGDAVPASVTVIVDETPQSLRGPYRVSDEAARVPAGMKDWETWLASFEPAVPPFPISPGSMIYTSGTTGHPKG